MPADPEPSKEDPAAVSEEQQHYVEEHEEEEEHHEEDQHYVEEHEEEQHDVEEPHEQEQHEEEEQHYVEEHEEEQQHVEEEHEEEEDHVEQQHEEEEEQQQQQQQHEEEPQPQQAEETIDSAPAPSTWLGSWWSGSPAPPQAEPANTPLKPTATAKDSDASQTTEETVDVVETEPMGTHSPGEDLIHSEQHHQEAPLPQSPSVATTEKENHDSNHQHHEEEEEAPVVPTPLDHADDDHADDAPVVRGCARIARDTHIPNADVALRWLRKFACKTRSKITTTYGGTKPRSIVSYIMMIKKSNQREDASFVAYRELMEILWDDVHKDPEEYYYHHYLQQQHQQDQQDNHHHHYYDADEDNPVHTHGPSDDAHWLGSVLGEYPGDDMARARRAMAAFVHLASLWGHASSWYLEPAHTNHHAAPPSTTMMNQAIFSDLLATCWDTATVLVAHGCFDGVEIEVVTGAATVSPTAAKPETQAAVNMLALSIFNSDLTMERNELAALKFLLTTGCRNLGDGRALLRGSHLLQTIRTLYHIYLTTESQSNKTTAKASLQQLVSSVFARVVQTDLEEHFQRTPDGFPSENHRDAFLVLRSICKLSMRNLPDPGTGLHSHIGIASSGSNATWNGMDDSQRGDAPQETPSEPPSAAPQEHAELIYTAAIHPALESKLLALDLIFYVLSNTNFSRGFISRAGSQFHAAVRNYLCVSLLKNCTSSDTRVVNVSLRLFAPLVRSFRTILKNEIEAFVTNVFFVILDSKNSPAEHKSIVVNTFEEICSDPSTLAEIFLNYDCDLSAVDLFHRIVNTLSKTARTGLQQEQRSVGIGFMGGASAARQERERSESRELRLDAMKALRQVLASLHASSVEPIGQRESLPASEQDGRDESLDTPANDTAGSVPNSPTKDSVSMDSSGQKLVEIYDSKKRRRAEESEVVLRFNQKPSAGIAYAVKCGHVDGDDPADVAQFLMKNKDAFEKGMIGEYLGREPEYQAGFSLKVLHEYVRLIDFEGLGFDDGIRLFLSGFRLPGEAQKIDRIMEKFAERYTEQNPQIFPSADTAFILAFSVIMLNTDLHNPAIKEERRMTKDGFVRNNRGICDGQDLPEEFLHGIFDRIKQNPISLKEDDEARQRAGERQPSSISSLSPASFFMSHYDEMDRARESNFQKERDHIVRTTEALLKRRRHGHDHHLKSQNRSRPEKQPRPVSRFVRTEDSGLRDEYVSPMFDVAWGAALAAFSTAMESANGTVGALISIASDEELEIAAENAAETIEVCLTGFRFAICTAGLCGNHVARDAFVLALSRFSQLGTGALLEPRHVRCIQTMMSLAREDGELLGPSWEHFFRALSEINRFHQLFHIMARNDRAAAAAAARRQKKREEREMRRREREARRAAEEEGDSLTDMASDELIDDESETEDSLAESDLFDENDEFPFEEDMDARAIDEANARVVYDAVSETMIEVIYERSSTLSAQAIKDFIKQLCFVSRSEVSVGGANLLYNNKGGDQFHHNQVNIYCLQKLVEVAHYNMESRPRLIFSDLWTMIADHLTFAALHFNPAIAMYAVDSFRQLSIQYLKRDELEVFEFQKRFLKPLEVIMARSEQESTKELLLNCVDRIILVFKTDETRGAVGSVTQPKGGLKSGWVPILTILGLGGMDANRDTAKQSFKILIDEIRACLRRPGGSSVLLSEHFVESVTALLMCATGPHEDIALKALEMLTKLSDYLVKEDVSTPMVRRKSTLNPSGIGNGTQNSMNEDLELWWPILLGLSRSVGDSRPELRAKALEMLMGVITCYFFPKDPDVSTPKRRRAHEDIQTLQIVFRGILFPILENAELGADTGGVPSLPGDFERFLTGPSDPSVDVSRSTEDASWLEAMFDPFMDACISLCLRSILVFKQDMLVEEVLALLTNCLMSDSGSLAVRGLHRLEQFITSDLSPSILDDEKWGAISHMLRRCLFVRHLPAIRQRPQREEGTSDDESQKDSKFEESYESLVSEFIDEDALFTDRRYIPGNATMVIGMLLSSERFSSLELRWRLFLIAGLGRAISEWERAAVILEPAYKVKDEPSTVPPSYYETALYGHLWMNRFILQLASSKQIAQAPNDADPKANRYAAGQKLVADETQRLLSYFLRSENRVAQYHHDTRDDALHSRLTSLVNELLSGFSKMESEHLKEIAWINPVLLQTCIQSKNENIRLAVQKLVQRTAPTPSPYPTPTAPVPKPTQTPPSAVSEVTAEEHNQNSNPANLQEQTQDESAAGDSSSEQQNDQVVIAKNDSVGHAEDIQGTTVSPDAIKNHVEVEPELVTTAESANQVLEQPTDDQQSTEMVVSLDLELSADGQALAVVENIVESEQLDRSSEAAERPVLPDDYFERAELLDFTPLEAVAEALRNPETYVLDIRNDDELSIGFVNHPNWRQCPGSRTENVILSSAPESVVPDRSATIIVYCQSGRRSDRAKKILLEQGYSGPILNAGGYEDIRTIL